MGIVTISRGSYSGAREVAEEVARLLEVPCLSREILAEAAAAAGVAGGKLDEVMERPPSFFERASRERRDYLAFVRAALCQRAAEGSFVYHGHDGQFLLPKLTNVLRVRIVAPLHQRVDAVKRDKDLDTRAAKRYIAKVDAHRARWTRFLHDVDWSDPLHYDLVLNLELIDPKTAAALIADLARTDRFVWTEALEAAAAEQALSSQVAAALTTTTEARGVELEVDAEGDVVVLRGPVRYDAVRQSIVEAVRQMPGVGEVRSELTIPSDALRS